MRSSTLRRPATLLAMLLSAGVAMPATAQEKPALPTGTSVRVTIDARRPMVGTVVYVTADSLAFRLEKTALLVETPLDSVTRLEVRAGTRRDVGRHALRGALIGGGIGAVLGVIAMASPDDGVFDLGAGYIAVGAGGGAVIGGGIGTLIGIASPHAVWQPLRIASLRAEVVGWRPGSGGVGLALRFRP